MGTVPGNITMESLAVQTIGVQTMTVQFFPGGGN